MLGTLALIGLLVVTILIALTIALLAVGIIALLEPAIDAYLGWLLRVQERLWNGWLTRRSQQEEEEHQVYRTG